MYDFKRERDALLAWQRRLREAWKRYDAPVGVGRCYAEEAEMLRRAIEGEPGKEE
jgi:hypothetical protein